MSENESSRREGFSVKMQITIFGGDQFIFFSFFKKNIFLKIIGSDLEKFIFVSIQNLFPCLFDLTFVFFYFSVKKLVNCKDWNLMNWTSQKKIVEVDLSREDDYLSLWHLKQFQACVVIIILSWKFNSQGGLPKIWAFFLSKQFLPVYYFECWFSA